MSAIHRQPEAKGGYRSHDHSSGRVTLPTETQRLSPAVARTLFERELAYYRADASYLPVEKCAERCRPLSVLLTLATATPDTTV